ncbi:MAG: polyprenyl synthetase [Candidatus Diapherotrites archaeon]|uniref:Polyprenyl synthetase n=1 Tax=Candidatus Iainarchaeum sp. TaxID=3101447 RepID=A0A2D6LQ25_9ARCH|nr:polyprenyl synthetase [Candidatus Diapherotrites archaeon]|tara:strand:+ start:28236 stop:29288 length:1053 start_codon:yes stop_codon:yes gene_type:complete
MSLEKFLKESAKDIDKELENFFPKKITAEWVTESLGEPEFSFDENSSQKAVVDPVWDFLDRGGKRWRPALMLLACEAVGGNKKDAMPFTVIPELVHNGTIMVDDVEDNSSLRRGKKSTHLIYGVDIAINAGNAMYFLPLVTLINDANISPEQKATIYDLYAKELLKLSFGQAMDIYWHKGHSEVTEQQYLQMTSYKTGSLSRLAVGLGVILGKGSEKQISVLSDFATSLGVAFQIHDDVLNLKPAEEWGKETGDDIQEGKRTIIVIHSFSLIDSNKKDQLTKILDAKENTVAEIKEAISILDGSGSIDYAKKFAKDIVAESWSNLDKALEDSDAKKMLKEFADYAINREI